MDISKLAEKLENAADGGAAHKLAQLQNDAGRSAADKHAERYSSAFRQAEEMARLRRIGIGRTALEESLARQEAMIRELATVSSAKQAMELATDFNRRFASMTAGASAAAVTLGVHELPSVKSQTAVEMINQRLASFNETLQRTEAFSAVSAARTAVADATRSAVLQAASSVALDLNKVMDGARLSVLANVQNIASAAAAYASGFKLPDALEASQHYAAAMRGLSVTADLARLTSAAEVHKASYEISRPWMNVVDPVRSMRGLIEMQGIGRLLSDSAPFSLEASAAYRSALGDWRDTVSFQSSVFADLEKRAALYRSRGFDGALTDMPADAFAQSVHVARVNIQRPPLLSIFVAPVEPSEDEHEEAAFERTNKAHDWLQRFETQVRRFIDQRMRASFGENWPRHRLPNGMYERWIEKRRKAGDRGHAAPLVAFADFTDYLLIIEKRDNWQEVFKAFFGRPEAVRESFQRLYPIRLDTMHARLITADDELYLYVEVRRIVSAITRH